MSQIEVTKLTQLVAIGPPEDNVSVSKLVMYVLLTPGSDGPEPPSPRQVHVYSQKYRRP